MFLTQPNVGDGSLCSVGGGTGQARQQQQQQLKRFPSDPQIQIHEKGVTQSPGEGSSQNLRPGVLVSRVTCRWAQAGT